MLCIIVIINNYFKIRIIAFAIIKNEMLDTFQQILIILFKEMSINPKTIFTNSNLFLISIIKKIYTDIKYLLYIFHIDLNFHRNLKANQEFILKNFNANFMFIEISYIRNYLNFNRYN